MPKRGGSNDQTRYDLVTNTEIDRSVVGVVRQRNTAGQCNHIARKQRQFHTWLALGDAITHGRHTTGDLCGCAVCARSFLDDIRKFLKRLMRRKHIVIG